MNHTPHQPSPAVVDLQIDIALEFVSAVQHLSRYRRMGLTVAEAIDEAVSEGASPMNESVNGRLGVETSGPETGITSTTPGSPTNAISLVSSLAAWTHRMAATFYDGEPWPHPEPTNGWPRSVE